eukprot:1028055-Pleurochrysis_carterae.AAC.1
MAHAPASHASSLLASQATGIMDKDIRDALACQLTISLPSGSKNVLQNAIYYSRRQIKRFAEPSELISWACPAATICESLCRRTGTVLRYCGYPSGALRYRHAFTRAVLTTGSHAHAHLTCLNRRWLAQPLAGLLGIRRKRSHVDFDGSGTPHATLGASRMQIARDCRTSRAYSSSSSASSSALAAMPMSASVLPMSPLISACRTHKVLLRNRSS